VLFAGILLGSWAGLLTGLACSLGAFGIWLAYATGFKETITIPNMAVDFLLVFIPSLMAVTLLQYTASRSIQQSLDQANHELAERRQAEQRLRESEQKFRSLVESSTDGIMLLDEWGIIIECNQAQEQLTGVPREEAIGQTGWDFQFQRLVPERQTPAMYERLRTGFEQILYTGQITLPGNVVETSFYREDGQVRFVAQKSFVIPTERGFRVAGISRDITERKRAEQELIESNRRLNTTINNLRGVVYRCDNHLDWTMEYVSDGIRDLSGYPAEDFIARRVRSYDSIIEPADLSRVWNEIQRAVARQEPFMLEYRIRTASGEQKWVWERGRGVFDGDQLVALEGFISNITERKNAEEEAIIEQRRLNSLLLISQMKTESQVDLLNCALEEAITLSDSQLGYIFLYDEEKQEFTLHAWSKQALETCNIPNPPMIYALESTGFWGEVVRQGGPVILNAFSAQHPLKKGFPEGHVLLFRFMSLPVFDGEHIVAVVGVANKPADYTDLDLRQLDMMMDSVWKIAKRKQAEVALVESERKFRAFIEQNSEGVMLIDEQGRIIEWNQAMERISGLAPQDVLGKPVWEVQIALAPAEHRTPENIERLRGYLRELQQFGDASPLTRPAEVLIVRPDGEQVPVQQVVFPIKTAAGNRLGSVARDISESKRSRQQIEALNADLLAAYDATIEGWAAALELRDQETEGHSLRVVELTLELARRMGIPEPEMIHLRRGAILHDIGKMGVPDSILLKPGKLTEAEWESMRQHPGYAYQMLLGIPFLRPATDIPYAHHERWDGSGYPRGLTGEDIPLAARIFAVIDVWDALLSNRPYRPAWPHAEVVQYLKEKAGQQFDPRIVEVFLEMMGEGVGSAVSC
jgi:PAS domain S-box-containing protein/putative nucleotidyltransferase with HDIG domain